MNFRVQGFHSSIHHFWKARMSGHFHHSDARFLQRPKRAPSRQNFHSSGRQRLAQLNNTGFIRNTDQCSANRKRHIFLRKRRLQPPLIVTALGGHFGRTNRVWLHNLGLGQ